MKASARVYLGLGANLGNRLHQLSTARRELQNLPLDDFRASSLYESVPYQGADQPLYYNQAISGRTALSPKQLLAACHAIEKKLGRIRKKRWESRLIDIDILYFDDLILESKALIIPHVDLANRGFVLLPLAELAPQWIDPRSQDTIETLLYRWKTHTTEPMPVRINALVPNWVVPLSLRGEI